ncbi:hypothetical protein [Aeromicrobium sp. UC242_57]|uniref:hypothetical protein n=1 Tax=Aeromicrobium sp. UC242_57 TaxID=3374624 RepID=UPI00378FB068
MAVQRVPRHPACRAPVVGALRTAEEFGRAFPGLTVVTSGGSTIVDSVDPGPVLVLATPGAEPHLIGGYRVVVLLDTWLMLGRDDVRVDEESHRRWFNALALAGPGATAVAVGDPATLQSLVRADPVGFAVRGWPTARRRICRRPGGSRSSTPTTTCWPSWLADPGRSMPRRSVRLLLIHVTPRRDSG